MPFALNTGVAEEISRRRRPVFEKNRSAGSVTRIFLGSNFLPWVCRYGNPTLLSALLSFVGDGSLFILPDTAACSSTPAP